MNTKFTILQGECRYTLVVSMIAYSLHCKCPVYSIDSETTFHLLAVRIGVASYGALGHLPPPLDFQHSYFVREQIRKMYKNNAILRNSYQFLAHFLSFFAHSFPQGVIIAPKMPERSPINFNSTRFR